MSLFCKKNNNPAGKKQIVISQLLKNPPVGINGKKFIKNAPSISKVFLLCITLFLKYKLYIFLKIIKNNFNKKNK